MENGKGRACLMCEGKGKLTCRVCEGKGRFGGFLTIGSTRCENCSGTGVDACVDCGGTGTLVLKGAAAPPRESPQEILIKSRQKISKKDAALEVLERSILSIYLDPRLAEVAVPVEHKGKTYCILQVGYRMPIPIPDLEVSDNGVSGTLNFAKEPHYCSIPWSAVFAIAGDDKRGAAYLEDLPWWRANAETRPSGLACSFCRTAKEKVGFLVTGPNLYVCDSCVSLCASLSVIVKANKPALDPVQQERGNTTNCSFCRKVREEVGFLIPGPNIQICDSCVQLCVDILEEAAEKSRAKKGEHEQAASTKNLLMLFSREKVAQKDLDALWSAIQDEPGRAATRRHEGLADALLELLTKLPPAEARARQSVVRILGMIGTKDAVPSLAAVLRSDSLSQIRNDAALSLGRIGGEAVLAPLVDACLADDLLASIGAAEALASMGIPEGIDAIRSKLCSLADEGILWGRANCQGTMFIIFPQYYRALEKLKDKSCAAATIRLLKDVYAKDHYSKDLAKQLLFIVLGLKDPDADRELTGIVSTEMPDLAHHLREAIHAMKMTRSSSEP